MPALPTSIVGRAARRAGRRPRPRRRARLRPSAVSTSRPSARDGSERRARVGRVEVAGDPGLPLAHRRQDRRAVGDRLVGRRRELAAQADPPGRSGVTRSTPAIGDAVAELADDLGRALGLVVAGDPERDRAGPHVGGRVERHVLDVDARAAEREGDLGDGARPVLDGDAQLGSGAAGDARPRAGARRSSRRRACQASTAPGSPARIRLAASLQAGDDGVDLVGDGVAVGDEDVAPDRRVGAGDAGRVAEARADLGQALAAPRRATPPACETSTFASTCGRWLTVAITRSCGRGVDRLRPGAEVARSRAGAGRRARRSSARSGSGTSARPRRGPRARSRRPAVSAPASGWPPMKRSAARRRRRARDQLALGRADVGDHGVVAGSRRAPRRPAPGSAPTGAAQKTTSAPAHGLGHRPGGLAERAELERRARGWPAPGRSRRPPRSRRRRGASPIEPPIRPTPRTATFIRPSTAPCPRPRRRARTWSAYSANRSVAIACGPSQIASSGSLCDLDDDPVGARGRCRQRHRLRPSRAGRRRGSGRRRPAGGVSSLQHGHGHQVEREAVRGLERADAALAEHHRTRCPP